MGVEGRAESGVSAGPSGASRFSRYLAVWLVAAVPALALITLLWRDFAATAPFAYISLGAFGLAFPVLVRRLVVPRTAEFVYFLLLAGLAFSVLSILTGWGNGLTDEPFTTPRFAAFTLSGHDPYTSQLIFTYQQYGATLHSQSYYLYLPLLMFLQFPGISYKWFALTCWAGMVLLARRRFDAATMLAQPYVVLLAASGYNDLPVLLLLTLGFVGWEGQRQKWAEYLSLGCKQFANAFVFVYYVVRRRWLDSAITLAVSAVFLVPFLIWGGSAVICPAVFADRLAACAAGGNAALLLNYPVWAVWVVAVFWVPLLVLLRRWAERPDVASRLARWHVEPARVRSVPSLLIVLASAISSGLIVFTLAIVGFGPSIIGVLIGGSLAGAGAMVWSIAWNGPWRLGRGSRQGARRARWILSQLAFVILAVAVLASWEALGGGALAGVSLGLGLGACASGALLWHWQLRDPVEPRRPTSAPSDPTHTDSVA
jgi:hypothetical protein